MANLSGTELAKAALSHAPLVSTGRPDWLLPDSPVTPYPDLTLADGARPVQCCCAQSNLDSEASSNTPLHRLAVNVMMVNVNHASRMPTLHSQRAWSGEDNMPPFQATLVMVS